MSIVGSLVDSLLWTWSREPVVISHRSLHSNIPATAAAACSSNTTTSSFIYSPSSTCCLIVYQLRRLVGYVIYSEDRITAGLDDEDKEREGERERDVQIQIIHAAYGTWTCILATMIHGHGSLAGHVRSV